MIGGGRIPEVLIGTWIVMGILLVFGFLARAAGRPVFASRFAVWVESVAAASRAITTRRSSAELRRNRFVPL